MINVRLSKCGGFVRSLMMLDYLREVGIRFQIGCHLGESGILSAAGRALALTCKDARYFDGSYDAYLLSENLTTRDVTFNQGGDAEEIPGPGLGVEVDKAKLRKMSLCDSISIKRPA
jgi:muconate cycloisomerase